MSSRRRKGLSEEDHTLWNRVARTATPIHPARPDPAPKRPFPPADTSDRTASEPIAPFELGSRAHAQTRIDLAVDPADSLSATAPRMDAGTHRRMQRGKMSPEARLDLHGMTLADAHPALIGFVQASHVAGRRLVLVITGKGRDRDEGGPIPARPGILRRQLPLWVSHPPLSALVLDVRPAHRRHGGSGAYYVYLRRPGKRR